MEEFGCRSDFWSLVAGRWSLVVGRWSLVVGRWSLTKKEEFAFDKIFFLQEILVKKQIKAQ